MQQLVVSFERLDVEDCVKATVEVFKTIPAPQREIERIFLLSLMLDIAVKLLRCLHRGLPQPCSCDLLLAQFAAALVERRASSPHHTLIAWLAEFEGFYRRAHSPSLALDAAALIRADPTRRWTVEALADRVGCGQRALAQEFRSTFGVTIHRYLGIWRLLTVYDRLNTDEKISAIADDAGYRSPKDFYRVVRECTGLTPRVLRLLSAPRRSELAHMLEVALTYHSAGHRHRQARVSAPATAMLKAVRRRAIALAERMQAAPLKPVSRRAK